MLFWERFYSLCSERKVKPNTVCAELGYSSATSTHWKNGTIPKGDVLLTLADYFHCSVDYLLGRGEQKNNAAVSIAEDSSTQKLIENYYLLNENAQKELLNYLEYMITKPENLKQDEGKRAV